jgi:hypothetical protein
MKVDAPWVFLFAAFACGPPQVADGDDDVGDEIADESTTGDDSTGDSTGDESTDDSSTSDDSTSDDSSDDWTSDDSTDDTDTDSTDTDSTDTETGPLPCEAVYEGSVMLDENTTPAEFEALKCVEHITGKLELDHTTVTDLTFLSSLIRVDRSVELRTNHQLIDLQGLAALEHVGRELVLYNNDALIDLQGLESLHELAGLSITYNSALTSLDGLGGAWTLHSSNPDATQVNLSISSNDALTSLDALADITSVEAELPVHVYLAENLALVGDLTGLAGVAASDIDLSLYVRNNHLESLIGLEGLTHAKSITLLGTGSQYTSLAGLDNLVSVEQSLTIGMCQGPDEVCADCFQALNHHHLAALDGLESLEQVGGTLRIWGSLVLADIDALAGVQTLGSMAITENPILPQAAVDSLIANVEVLGSIYADPNGTGDEPICGFIPW